MEGAKTKTKTKTKTILILLFLLSGLSFVFVIPEGYAGVIDTKILDSGDEYLHGSMFYNGSLWFSERDTPTASVFKMDTETLDYQEVVLTDIAYAEEIENAENYVWTIGRHLTYSYLVRINPSNLSWNIAINFSGLTLVESLLYYSNFMWVGGAGKIAKVNLTDYSYNVYDYSSVTSTAKIHALSGGNNSVWATTGIGVQTGVILRINPSNPTSYTYTDINKTISDDTLYLNGHFYLGTEETSSRIYKVKGDNVSDYEYIQIGNSKCYGVFTDGNDIWSAYAGSSGVIRQLNQSLILLDSFSLPSGYNDANEIVFDDSGIQYITCWMSPARIVKQATGEYNLYGAYNEYGTRQGAINVTVYRQGQSAETFELDGTYPIFAATNPYSFHFDIGANHSRGYYIKDATEEIYVFKPSEPYFIYYITVLDYVGVTNAYLESLINVNGTNMVVERWKLDFINDIPLTVSWGVVYTLRVVCEEGTYVFGQYLATVDQDLTLCITSNAFPPEATYVGYITVNSLRLSESVIQTNYTDIENMTSWVYIQIYTFPSYTLMYYGNNSGSTVQSNWTQAQTYRDYIVKVQAQHEEGLKTWSFTCPYEEEYVGVWDGLQDILGATPIPATDIFAIASLLIVFGCFGYASLQLGIMVTTILAWFYWYIKWLGTTQTALTTVTCVSFLLIFRLSKRELRRV